MKERPIIFSGPMVKAILDGSKTQTRRVVQLQPTSPATIFDVGGDLPVWAIWPSEDLDEAGHPKDHGIKCPYGRPGDRLWVREAFSLVPCSAGCEKYPDGFDPRVASVHQPNAPHEGVRYKATWDRCHSAPWRPSIHMPRWASRITLEVTGVRVERLKEISHEDSVAEGFGPHLQEKTRNAPNGKTWGPLGFSQLWDKINGASHPWESNPWVWVVTFRKAVGS